MHLPSTSAVRLLADWQQQRRALSDRVDSLLLHGPTAVDRVAVRADELREALDAERAAFEAFVAGAEGAGAGPERPGRRRAGAAVPAPARRARPRRLTAPQQTSVHPVTPPLPPAMDSSGPEQDGGDVPHEPTQDGDGDQLRLRAALNRYLVARSTPADDPELSAARLGLVAVLEEAGWEPPAAVRAALAADERASRQAGRRSA